MDGDGAGVVEAGAGAGGEGDDGVGLMLGLGGEGGDGIGLMLGLILGLSGDGGEDDIGTGEEGVWALGESVGVVAGGMIECVGAGLGAWAADIVTMARDMASTSVARASAMVARGRKGRLGVGVTAEEAEWF